MASSPKWRVWLFTVAMIANIASLACMVILRVVSRHWGGLYGHVNDLSNWVGRGAIAALIALIFGWFGFGWKRIAALLVALVCCLVWLNESGAV